MEEACGTLLDHLLEDDAEGAPLYANTPFALDIQHRQTSPTNPIPNADLRCPRLSPYSGHESDLAFELARRLLEFVRNRPESPAHAALTHASNAGDEELADRPVVLKLNALELIQNDPIFGRLFEHMEDVRLQVMSTLHESGILSVQHPRLWLRLDQVPIPEFACLKHISLMSSNAVSNPVERLVNVTGVVCAVSSTWANCYARTWICNACETSVQCLEGKHPPGCCEAALQEREEDLSQRCLVPAQDVWLADIESPHHGDAFCACLTPVVRLVDDLVGLRLGDVVNVTGRLRPRFGTLVSGSRKPVPGIELAASSATRCDLFMRWSGLSPCSTNCEDASPLQTLCNTLMAALSYAVPYSLCLAILLSAASVGAAYSPNAMHGGTINVLVCQEPDDPILLQRILKPASQILCPHTVCLSSGVDDMILPRLQAHGAASGTDGLGIQVTWASALTMCNNGLLVIDGLTLGSVSKIQTELAEALTQGAVLPAGSKPCGKRTRGGDANCGAVPVTATVWLASHGLPTEDWAEAFSSESKPASGTKPPPGCIGPAGFHLVLPYVQEAETQVELMNSHSESATASSREVAIQATNMLRSKLAKSRAMPEPRFDPSAVQLLQRYVMCVRVGTIGTSVPASQLITLLVSMARAAARWLGSDQVRAHPDCVVAILLAEDTICNRLGSRYNSRMPRLEAGASAQLDTIVSELYEHLDMMLNADGSGATSSVAAGPWPSC